MKVLIKSTSKHRDGGGHGNKFKDQLSLGVASAATQIEGGDSGHYWNDWYVKENMKDNSNPARATDHYKLWKEDANFN